MEAIKVIRVNENIELRQIGLSDAEAIFDTINTQREYLGKWLPFVESTQTVEDTRNYIRTVLAVPEEKGERIFVIHVQDKFAGLCGLKDTDLEKRQTEIGYWLSELYQKKGVVTESVKVLMQFASINLHINKFLIKCAVGNIPSKNIPLKLGYQLAGIEKDGELLTGGNYTDIEVYCIEK
ncbi:MAG: GNAT family N-acetyltransferase [Bacteroidales bacterium]|nr:GNAT family N-acetyltransferase [Bacteroidales bacterium]